MEIVISAPQDGFANALEREMRGLTDVWIDRGSIFDVDCDALVSPANSFGFMDGGLDRLYTAHFGEQLQTRVRLQR